MVIGFRSSSTNIHYHSTLPLISLINQPTISCFYLKKVIVLLFQHFFHSFLVWCWGWGPPPKQEVVGCLSFCCVAEHAPPIIHSTTPSELLLNWIDWSCAAFFFNQLISLFCWLWWPPSASSGCFLHKKINLFNSGMIGYGCRSHRQSQHFSNSIKQEEPTTFIKQK